MATGNAEKECEAVIARFDEIGKELGISDDILLTIAEDIKRRLKLYSGNRKKFLDVMKAAGEDNCARLVAGYLQSLGNNAHYIN